MYVPVEHFTSSVAWHGSIFKMFIEWMFMVDGLRFISLPWRASSYSFLPLTFLAENIGGVCLIWPMNCGMVFSKSS